MFLYFDGCSYTVGIDCENKEENRFSTLVSKHFNADHVNASVKASSNDEITRRTFEFLKDNTCDYAIILMTHCTRFELSRRLMPGGKLGWLSEDEQNIYNTFYENYYNEHVGSINFYKNRYLLEQEFKRRNIPLILFQYFPVSQNNIWREMCGDDLPLVTTGLMDRRNSLLGRKRNKEYFWCEKFNKPVDHFNRKGHRKIADFIISQIDAH
tara:strand:- start:44 stop:676 length:633 start_codon:yes stop_codon:yes gene_type:complete